MIPGYELLDELGRGGMGVVYKARQIALNRVVALKMILAGSYAGSRERERFRLEAEAVARLQHPNIVQVHEVGEHDGRPYFSLEFCAGGSLTRKLAAGPLPPREAAIVAENLARGMAVAHARGVIHRDLKPANVLLAADGTPKVADFGLAKLLDSDSRQTATDAVMGTPCYMSPEQAAGGSRDVGPTSDVYSLGAVLYEMLTGQVPFRGASVPETLELVRSQEPVSVRRHQPHVPRDLETVCLKCLQKDPTSRYASADALADDLRRFLNGEPVRARSVGRVERASKWVRRNPALSAALAVVAVSLVTATVVSTLFAFEASERAKGERAARSHAESREAEALAARDDAVKARTEADGARNEAVKARDAADKSRGDAVKARNDLADKAAALELQVYKSQIALAHQEWQLIDARASSTLLAACRPELRGWEWDFVNRLCNLQRRQLRLPSAPLGVAVRPDGRHVAVAQRDGALRVYETETLSLVAEVKHATPPHAHIQFGRVVAYSPDGSLLASAMMADTVLLLDGEKPSRELGQLKDAKEHLERFTAVAFSPDGKTLATAGGQEGIVESYTLKLWSVAERKLLKTLKGHRNSLAAVAFHPTNGQVATAGNDKRVLVWDPTKDTPVLDIKDHPGVARAVAFSPKGTMLASGCEDGTVRVWDPTTGKLLRELEGHGGRVNGIAFNADGSRLASASTDTNVKVWDPVAGREVFTLRGHRWAATDVAFRPGSDELVAVSDDRDLRVWDAVHDPQSRIFSDHASGLREGLYSPKGRWLAILSGWASSEQAAVHIYDAKTGKPERVISLKSPVSGWLPAYSMAFHPEDKLIATGAGGLMNHGEVVVCDPATGEVVWRRSVLNHTVAAVRFSPDGKHLAVSGTAVNKIVLVDAFTGKEVRAVPLPNQGAIAMAYSADGSRFAAIESQGPVRVWRTDTWELLHTLPAGVGSWNCSARAVAFHPKDKYLAVAANVNVVVLYDPATGGEIRRLKGHASGVGCVAFSPDGQRLFTTGRQDRFVKVWDPDRGESLFTLRGVRGNVYAVSPSPDGKRLLVTTENFTAHEFDATPPGK
jgi:WD40 repeat protein